ncbi:hypothetical protein MY5147_007193 [Beauveria neobassiana]
MHAAKISTKQQQQQLTIIMMHFGGTCTPKWRAAAMPQIRAHEPANLTLPGHLGSLRIPPITTTISVTHHHHHHHHHHHLATHPATTTHRRRPSQLAPAPSPTLVTVVPDMDSPTLDATWTAPMATTKLSPAPSRLHQNYQIRLP